MGQVVPFPGSRQVRPSPDSRSAAGPGEIDLAQVLAPIRTGSLAAPHPVASRLADGSLRIVERVWCGADLGWVDVAPGIALSGAHAALLAAVLHCQAPAGPYRVRPGVGEWVVTAPPLPRPLGPTPSEPVVIARFRAEAAATQYCAFRNAVALLAPLPSPRVTLHVAPEEPK